MTKALWKLWHLYNINRTRKTFSTPHTPCHLLQFVQSCNQVILMAILLTDQSSYKTQHNTGGKSVCPRGRKVLAWTGSYTMWFPWIVNDLTTKARAGIKLTEYYCPNKGWHNELTVGVRLAERSSLWSECGQLFPSIPLTLALYTTGANHNTLMFPSNFTESLLLFT